MGWLGPSRSPFSCLNRWHALFDCEGLAGGPGRTIDLSLNKFDYNINESWGLSHLLIKTIQ